MNRIDLAAWLPVFLQTNDTLFPTGGYAHSFGFEEFVKLSGMRGEVELRQFVLERVLPALTHQELPYLRFAWEVAVDIPGLCEVDREISAWKTARELREASIQVGMRRLAALRAAEERPIYAEFARAVAKGAAAGHHLSVCALQARGEGFPLEAALTAYSYQAIAGICSAAMKLIRIGQEGCQRVLRSALGRVEETIAGSRGVDREEAGWFDPLLEIAAMRHETAEERLFIS